MPILITNSTTRRSFVSAALGATILRAAGPEMRWALLSDTHIPADPGNAYRGFKPYDTFQKAIAGASGSKPDGVLICGDLARNEGLPGDYQNLRKLLEPVPAGTPVALALGNHDNRANCLDVFAASQPGRQTVKGRHVLVVEGPAARFIVLDSLMGPNTVPGFLGKIQRDWLAGYLKSSSELPTILFVHHPLDDNDNNLLDAPRLLEIVRPVGKVKAIVYGHSHKYALDTWEGIQLINLPSTGYNFADADPIGWIEAVVTGKGAALTLRAIGGNTEKNGQTVQVSWRG